MNWLPVLLIIPLLAGTEPSCWVRVIQKHRDKTESVKVSESMYGAPFYANLTLKDYTVPVYNTCDTDNVINQKVVDAKNAAAYFTFDGNTYIIADHVHQGFSVIKSLTTGDEIHLGDEDYIVTDIDPNGVNNRDLYYSDGTDAVIGNDADLLLYTCNSKKPYIAIVSCVKK